MKKIIVLNTKYKNFGGEDSNIIDEVNLLTKYFDVEYLEFDNAKNMDLSTGIGFFTNSNSSSNKSLESLINKFNPDLAYVHNTWFKLNLGIFKILDNYNIKTLVKLHNFRYDCARHILRKDHLKGQDVCRACNISRNNLGILNKYYDNSYTKSFFVSRHSKEFFNKLKNDNMKILVISDFHKNHLVNLGINSDKIDTYFNPISIVKNSFENYPSNSPYVVYAGRLSNDKGIKELIETWESAEIKDIKLKIIGADEQNGILSIIEKSKNVEYEGLLNNEETKKLIKNSRAVITATKLYEGQPRLLCEASSYGVPSIYPSFGGMNEFFPKDYNLSFEQFNYLDLKEKIEKINDEEAMKVASKKVFNHIVEKLGEEKLINTFNEIIRKLDS